MNLTHIQRVQMLQIHATADIRSVEEAREVYRTAKSFLNNSKTATD